MCVQQGCHEAYENDGVTKTTTIHIVVQWYLHMKMVTGIFGMGSNLMVATYLNNGFLKKNKTYQAKCSSLMRKLQCGPIHKTSLSSYQS